MRDRSRRRAAPGSFPPAPVAVPQQPAATVRSGVSSAEYSPDKDNRDMDEPKTAFELAMERLKKQDAESGAVQHKLTEAQKTAIAEARSVYEARVAERQILHRQKRL